MRRAERQRGGDAGVLGFAVRVVLVRVVVAWAVGAGMVAARVATFAAVTVAFTVRAALAGAPPAM